MRALGRVFNTFEGYHLMTNKGHYLTPEGKEKLEKELDRLKTVRRKEIADKLRRAIEEGDLSENFGYSESKREQAMLEGRILEISALLANAQVLAPNHGDHVGLGSTVVVAESGQEPETYRIVGPAEADPRQARISHESPLGKALLNHKVGDRVEIQTPGGAIEFEILSVE